MISSLSLVLWLSYSGLPDVTNAEVGLIPDLPAWACRQALQAEDKEAFLDKLGSAGLQAKAMLRAKKERHPRMSWGLRCIPMDGA